MATLYSEQILGTQYCNFRKAGIFSAGPKFSSFASWPFFMKNIFVELEIFSPFSSESSAATL